MISSVAELDATLTRPSPPLVDLFTRLSGDLTILGVAGKMGVSLAVLAARAAREAGSSSTVTGVARFSDPAHRQTLEAAGVNTVTCDLLDPTQLSALPVTGNVVFMVARKFGTTGSEPSTWATNTVPAVNTARHFSASRIVAFSTGCVYPLASPASGGCSESTPPAPVGEYAWSCLARERIFEFYSRKNNTPTCLLRLNYAIDLRYGVLHDLATTIAAGKPVDLTTAHFNCIWQGDANTQALLALGHTTGPPSTLNITSPQTHSTEQTARALAEKMRLPVAFTGTPSPVAYLSNPATATALFGPPTVAFDTMLDWTASWVKAGLPSLGKPTHFQTQDGTF
ncbi:MAG: NAD(P)-dependent oxidoreductase [Verrucomicrobiales bacterium]|nr:NAD(P)-dependent oxidoreductase [Verrucomicrobiales bacterium]